MMAEYETGSVSRLAGEATISHTRTNFCIPVCTSPKEGQLLLEITYCIIKSRGRALIGE